MGMSSAKQLVQPWGGGESSGINFSNPMSASKWPWSVQRQMVAAHLHTAVVDT
ncbi:MAG: hypothetical protein OEW23_06885 [Candidatus Aminicenantes bacterium]|nr:hypothetical protein [Candidatus Aminicenantes bacterium]